MLKPLTMWITTNWKILKEMEILDHLTYFLGIVSTDRFKTGKGVHQGCLLSPCLFNLYAEYIMQNAGLDKAQAGTKITWRNINNFRYVDDSTLMAESREELKNLLMRVKE